MDPFTVPTETNSVTTPSPDGESMHTQRNLIRSLSSLTLTGIRVIAGECTQQADNRARFTYCWNKHDTRWDAWAQQLWTWCLVSDVLHPEFHTLQCLELMESDEVKHIQSAVVLWVKSKENRQIIYCWEEGHMIPHRSTLHSLLEYFTLKTKLPLRNMQKENCMFSYCLLDIYSLWCVCILVSTWLPWPQARGLFTLSSFLCRNKRKWTLGDPLGFPSGKTKTDV